MSISVTFEYGLVIRRKALSKHSISLEQVLSVLEVDKPEDEDKDLISFGPGFGYESLETLVSRLTALGLIYTDDFFELVYDHPQWLKFSVSHVE